VKLMVLKNFELHKLKYKRSLLVNFPEV